jgi:UDPglucose 6-dehydrogenase
MIKQLKIGIVGHGFVGKAVSYGFTHRDVTQFVVDPQYGTSIDNLPYDCDVVFVCVPTPMGEDGSIDAYILKSVISELHNRFSYGLKRCLFVIKSTVTPDVIEDFAYSGIVYNPEFLAEKNAMHDFVNPQFHVFGGDADDTHKLEKIYKTYSMCSPCRTFHVSHVEASFIKYGINTFLATKVTFFNQLFDTINNVPKANFANIVSVIGSDDRIGHSHTKVPGFDGKQGFGGACFPKDMAAFAHYSNRLTLVEECIRVNNQYRSKYELDEREIAQHVNYEQAKKEQ